LDSRDILFEQVSLGNKVYEYLRNQIVSGEFPPDTRLPENELAAKLQVSRVPVREALNMLISDGFVVRIPRHGAVVAPVTRKEIDENWETRILLEPYAAKLACGNIPNFELNAVKKQIVNTMLCMDFNMYMDSDHRIHSVIYQYVPNTLIRKFLSQIMLSSMRYRYYTENNLPTSEEVINSVCQEHLDLVDALLSEDKEKAYQAMLSHTQQSYQRILKQMANSDLDIADK